MNRLQDRLVFHTWTLDTTPLAEVLRAVRQAGWKGVELRHADFVRCAESGMSNAQVLDLVRASGLKVGTLGMEYGILFAKGDDRRRLFKSLEQTCSNSVALGCDLLMTATGPGEGNAKEAAANLKEAGDVAKAHGLRIAYEYSAAHEWLNNFEAARDVLARVGHPNVGWLVDAYHFERSGSGGRGFESIPSREIFAFQYSDVPGTPLKIGERPTDRLVPGRGLVRWKDVFQLLIEKNYGGWLSYEAPNPDTWARPPEEAAREAVTATRKLLAAVE